MSLPLLAILLTGSGQQDQTLVVEGFRPPADAAVSASAMKYLPFQVPPGCTGLRIHKEFEGGGNTVDFGLFDSRGTVKGFRGWQGGVAEDAVVTGSVETTGTWFIPGPIQPGTWNIAQYFLKSSAAGLKYRYTVTLNFSGPKPPGQIVPTPPYKPGVLASEAGWYPGNLHCHSLHSDGGNSFVDLARINQQAGFRFMVSTEHNNITSAYHFPEAAQAAPGLLIIEGDEFTSPYGHAGILGSKPGHWFDFRFDGGQGRLPGVIKEAHRDGGLFVVNHPGAVCTSCTWRYPDNEWSQADGIEVWNGAWDLTDQIAVNLWERRLRSGERINAYGGTDYHRGKDPLSPATFVYSRSLSRGEILKGLRQGATVLCESPKGPMLSATLDGFRPGSEVKASAHSNLHIKTSSLPAGILIVRTDSGASQYPVDASKDLEVKIDTSASHFVRVELRKSTASGLMIAMTNAFFIR